MTIITTRKSQIIEKKKEKKFNQLLLHSWFLKIIFHFIFNFFITEHRKLHDTENLLSDALESMHLRAGYFTH